MDCVVFIIPDGIEIYTISKDMGEPTDILQLVRDFNSRRYRESLAPITAFLDKHPKALGSLELREAYEGKHEKLFEFLVAHTKKHRLQDYDSKPTIVDICMKHKDIDMAARLLLDDFKLMYADRNSLKALFAKIGTLSPSDSLFGRLHVTEVPRYLASQMKTIQSEFDIDITVVPNSATDHSFLLPKQDKALNKWIRGQKTYLEGNPRVKALIRSYTRRGDRIANGYLRGKLNAPQPLLNAIATDDIVPFAYQIYDNYDFLVKQGLKMPPKESLMDGLKINDSVVCALFKENLEFFGKHHILQPLAKAYCRDVLHAIHNAPRAESDIYVYRGVRDEKHLSKGTLSYVETSFQSTSISPFAAASAAYTDQYLRTPYKFCIYEVKIPAGTPCVYAGSVSHFENEYEIILPYNLKMILKPDIYLKYETDRAELMRYGAEYYDDFFIDSLKQVFVRPCVVQGVSGYEAPLVAKRSSKTKKAKKGNFIRVSSRRARAG